MSEIVMSGITLKPSPSYGYDKGSIMKLKTGQMIGIADLLGLGGQAQVYGGVDMHSGVKFAVKLMDPFLAATRPDLREEFEHEGRLLARLGSSPKGNHKNIVALRFMSETEGGIPVLGMELLCGLTLQALLNKIPGGKLPLPKVIEIGKQIAVGMCHAHLLRVLHLDLKPDNIFIHIDADGIWIVKIIDFGGHRLLDDIASGRGAGRVFTSPFASPEQLLGRLVGETADVFSLGVTLYRASSGQMPFHGVGPSYDDQRRRLTRMPDPIRMHGDFPWEWEDFLQRMMHPNHAMRQQDMMRVIMGLKPIQLRHGYETERSPMPTEERAIMYTEGMETLTRKSLMPPSMEYLQRAASTHVVYNVAGFTTQEPSRHAPAPAPSTQEAPISPSVLAELQRAQEEAEALRKEGARDTNVDPIRADRFDSSLRPASAPTPNAPASNQPVPPAQAPVPRGKGWTLKMDNPGPLPLPPPEWSQPPAPAPRGKGWTLPMGNSVLVDKSSEAWAPEAPAQPKSETRQIQDRPTPQSSHQPPPPQQDPQPTPSQPEPTQQMQDEARGDVEVPCTPSFEFLRAVWRERPLYDCIDVVLVFANVLVPTHRLREAYMKLMQSYLARSPRWRPLSTILVGTFLLLTISLVVFLWLSASPARAPVAPPPPVVSSPASAVAPAPLPPPAQNVMPTPSASASPVVSNPKRLP
ncbi:MAG: serine/threonine protein kinase [Polyangiaceae bacterium]|nr:serine/threonine protein kinase [Polyangiaceae bacterium]